MSSGEAARYKTDVFELLRSESYDAYLETLKVLKSKWADKFAIYYDKCLHESILDSYRVVLEEKGLYSELSGMTNNPAESTNASFKKIADLKNASLFQAISGWYFFQVDGLIEILRGMENSGDFTLSGPIPNGVNKPAQIRDALNPEIISSLICNGKVPPGLQTSHTYKSTSLHEATTLRGLARMYIEKNHVTLLPKQKVFVVTGLLGKTFIVSKYGYNYLSNLHTTK